MPLSKSGQPFVSPKPQPSIGLPQWLDIARLAVPNLVDYFTKTPPPPVYPSTPGKMPSVDSNPYAPGAIADAAKLGALLLSVPEGGIVGPLAGRLAPEFLVSTDASLGPAQVAGLTSRIGLSSAAVLPLPARKK